MDDKHKVDSATEFSTESTWTLGGNSDGAYFFFGNDRDSTILSEFGWNLPPERAEASGCAFGELNRIDSDLAGSSTLSLPESTTTSAVQDYGAGPAVQAGPIEEVGDASMLNRSSCSSDDLPEKSTVSGGSGGKPPSKTASKVKKKGQKRIRQQRFAFMTKSDVDNLEDGYRWRKYGQKAVKNSPFPRSYYRCTNSTCTVKKRVERFSEDATIVITTYEGQHCHHTVGFPRAGGLNINHGPAFSAPQFYYPRVQFPQQGSLSITQSRQISGEAEERRVLPEATRRLPADEGLLGDMVPPEMRNR